MIWMLFVLALLSPSLVEAACGGSSPNLTVAATGLNTDLDDCVTAAADGDTITMPAGTFTWTGTSTISNKSITITGAGAGTEAQCNAGGQTTYTCIKRAGPMISWTTKATGNSPAGFSQLKNMTVWVTTGASGCSTYSVAGASIFGTSTNVRVTGMRFIYGTNCGGLIMGDVFGVVDHSAFVSKDNVDHGIVVRHNAYLGVGNYGDNSWAQASSMGGANNVFIEDNTFEGTDSNVVNAATDHFRGGRAVMRFNTLTMQQFQSHGTESGGRPRSVRHVEVYRNQMDWGVLTTSPTMVAVRGGTGRIFDNKATGTMLRVVDFNTYRAAPNRPIASAWPWAFCVKHTVTSITRSGSTATVTTPSAHGVQAGTSAAYITVAGADQAEYNGTYVVTGINATQYSYTVSGTPATPATGTITAGGAFDGNTDAAGYPCLDQTGRGHDTTLIGGDIPSMTNVHASNQVLDPLYIWNNTDDGVVSNGAASASEDVIVENRDFYNQNASFTGATGIGRGTRASRPATCTTGTAYWSTDGGGNWNTSTTETYSDTPGEDGGLDVCTATNTWTNDSYVPYTYPHDLNDGGSGLPPAEAPTRFAPSINLRRVDAGELAMVGE